MIFASLSLLVVACASICSAQEAATLFVDDLLEFNTVNHTWMEIGYATLTDTEWTTITTTVNNLNPNNARDMSVFMSLPEYGGSTAQDGWSMVVKMNGRAQKISNGAYQFQARLVQPNDSYCPYLWSVLKPTPAISVGWLIVEEGVYNVSSSMLVFGSGEVTRENSIPLLKDDTPVLYHAKVTLNFTTGCDANDPDAVCEFVEKVSDVSYSSTGWSHLGATNQLQTSINKVPGDSSKEMWMNTRVRNVFPDRIAILLAVHSVFVNDADADAAVSPNNFNFTSYPDYADIHVAETASYFVWEKDMRLNCFEGLVMETSIQYPITDSYLQMDYFYDFEKIPGLFGMIGTLNSVGDTTSLRVFNRTITGANFITQEDQCTDEEEKHVAKESAFTMVVGKAKDLIGDTNCFIAFDVQPCTYTIYLYDLFMDGWDNVELVIDTGDEILNVTTSCGSKEVTFTSRSCTFDAHMATSDGAQPVTWWENYWRYEHASTSVVYLGDYDSTITVVREVVTFTDLANTRVDAKENKCEQCKVAPPPPAKGMGPGGFGKGPLGNGDGAGAGDGNAGNGGVADLSAGNVAPPPAGVGVAPGDAGAPFGTLQITGVSGAIDAGAAPGANTYTAVFALNVAGLSSAPDSIGFYRGATGIEGPSLHAIDVTGLTNAFFLEGSFVVSEADINLWINGGIYIQITTATHLTGEIRAQAVLPSDWIAYYNELNGLDGDAGDADTDIVGDGFGKTGDAKGPGAGKGAGAGGKGAGKGAGAGNKGPAPPVPVLIELFDDAGLGWYNKSGSWSFPMKVSNPAPSRRQLHLAADPSVITMDTTLATFPDILMYPTYVIMTADKTKQLHVGSLCPHRQVERCEERLPPKGEFVFRVMGKDPEGDDHWKFCGVEGTIGQELQFEMKKGKCVAISITNAYTYCSFNTQVTLTGGLVLAGVSTDFSELDSKVLENEVASMLVSTTHVSIVSWNVNADGNMEVVFEAVILTENQGVDGSIRANVDTLVTTLQTNMQSAFASGAFMASMDLALSEYPQSLMGITKATGASLTSLEIVKIVYVEASTTIAERSPASLPYASVQETETVTATVTPEESMSVITACAIVAAVVIVAAVALRSRDTKDFKHQELPVDSEHADSIPEFDLGLEQAAAPRGLFFVSKERF